jgi:DNA end-binding protein Ku
MAEQLVDSLAAAFEPEKYRDTYREQVLDLIEKKAAGEAFELPEPAAEAPKVVDLMAALEASVQAAKDARGRHPAAQKPKVVRAKRTTKADDAEAQEAEEAPRPKRARARKSA